MSRKTDILDFIQKFSHEKGYSPTIREIGTGIGLSPSSVYYYIQQSRRPSGLWKTNWQLNSLALRKAWP